MKKINFTDFQRIMSYDITKKQDLCIEIEFLVDKYKDYQESWLGKMLDKDTHQPIYWFGLTKDGLQGYDYDSFEQFADAKVFQGIKSLKEIWDSVSLLSIDACDVEDRLAYYLGSSRI